MPVEAEDLHEPPGPEGPAEDDGEIHEAAGCQVPGHAVLQAVGHLGPPPRMTHNMALPLLHPAGTPQSWSTDSSQVPQDFAPCAVPRQSKTWGHS